MKKPYALIGAAAVAALFALMPVQRASANDFTDSCTAGGGGLLEAKDCQCFDGKVTDKGDRSSLMAYFKINADIAKGGTPSTSDATSAAMQKGTELVGKYAGECMK